mmetsp:Transcript_8573/g.24616  ORF Transcript_8573/g.24616 Transcript_8573/m.24616 type:complete len:407 (-) Transcript_8573:242-1462(-)|eukprot:CAMPEP_0117697176 /NCGR_PEP_ID=MMETSP0804-20121206/29082_1 /TAXON_ID=1074897 /ORGANISM="Tetraselmis astigmatica, Strain CCMP880" /LENGTH=406 /DNA_ID=CAMNT_0005511395 /DNA_START=122 /DNA_END=1342 /DNA_ORIENTATION=-
MAVTGAHKSPCSWATTTAWLCGLLLVALETPAGAYPEGMAEGWSVNPSHGQLQCLEPYRRQVPDRGMGIHGLGAVLADRRGGADTSMPPEIFVENVPLVLERQRTTVCMVEKCGSTRFKLLFERGMGYTADEQLVEGGFRPHNATMRGVPSKMDGYISGILNPGRPRVIIVRNPYARVLSAFLNKLACQSISCMMVRERVLDEVPGLPADIHDIARYPQTLAFSIFIRALYDAYTESCKAARLMGTTMVFPLTNAHFMPITQLCMWNYGFGYDYVLPLEEISSWYGGFLALTDLEDVAATGWDIQSYMNMDADEPCFYRPPGMGCRDVPQMKEACGVVNCQAEVLGSPQLQQRSATKAQDKLDDFYTPELATKVTTMYMEDIRQFHYPTYNGVGNIKYDLTKSSCS